MLSESSGERTLAHSVQFTRKQSEVFMRCYLNRERDSRGRNPGASVFSVEKHKTARMSCEGDAFFLMHVSTLTIYAQLQKPQPALIDGW